MSSQFARMLRNNDPLKPLSYDHLAKVAPSIFQTEAHESRSVNYKPVPTIAVLEGLKSEGWLPFGVQQSIVREPGRAAFNKHMLRLRRFGDDAMIVRGQPEFNELVVVNSHDGTSSFQLMAGMFRLVCTNGMIAGKQFGSVHLYHRGDVLTDVIDGVTRIVEQFTLIDKYRDEMARIELDPASRMAFAQTALRLRYGDDEPPISPESIVNARRPFDVGNSLWTVFNVVQENMIKGGIRGVAQSGRRMMTRGISGVDQDLTLNRMLWDLADFTRRLANGERPEDIGVPGLVDDVIEV